MNLPRLPSRAAYLTIDNAKRRNALSLAVLRSLRDQLHKYNTSPADGKLRILPPFNPSLLSSLETSSQKPNIGATDEHAWLLSASAWREHRAGLPKVIILRSTGPVFSSGHDLGEIRQLSYDEVKETFALCAEVMSLIRRSPAPVIGAVHGLATAAGCQLGLSTDIVLAKASTPFQLPGASIGLPCTSPSTAVARKLGNAFTYRMLALAEPMKAEDLPGGAVEVVKEDTEEAFERRLGEMVQKLASTAGQPQALGKWAYWTQVGMDRREGGSGGDGYEDAVGWAGKVMALHARSEDAREGMNAFFEKRKADWKT